MPSALSEERIGGHKNGARALTRKKTHHRAMLQVDSLTGDTPPFWKSFAPT
eukprot:UN17182